MPSVSTLFSTTADFSAAVAAFPGVFDSTAGITPSDTYSTNGTYLQSATTTPYTQGTGDVDVGTTGVTTDMYAWVAWNGLADGVDGYFEIASIDVGTSVEIGGALSDGVVASVDGDVDIYIGGVSDALDGSPTLQDELDFIGPAAGATPGNTVSNLTILCHADSALTTIATVDIDNISGSTTTKVELPAKTSDFTTASTIEVTTATSLANGLFELGTGSVAVTDIHWHGWDFNCGAGAGNADYGIYGNYNNLNRHSFKDCTFRNADLDGVYYIGFNISLLNCVCHTNGRYGGQITTRSSQFIFNSIFRDNTSDNLRINAKSTVDYCLFYGSTGGYGFYSRPSADGSRVFNNVSYDNNLGGYYVDASSNSMQFYNNSATSNTTYGYYFAGSVMPSNFCNNHAYGNSTNPLFFDSASRNDAYFQTFGCGDNLTTDPDFTNAAGGVFTIPATSPLYLAGVGGRVHIGAEAATQGVGGGGLNRLAGLLG